MFWLLLEDIFGMARTHSKNSQVSARDLQRLHMGCIPSHLT
jgi:hypothetical protein